MNSYPSEIRTPPLPSVLLFGQPKLHTQVEAFLTRVSRPPAHVISVTDLDKVSNYFRPRKPAGTQSSQPKGILKAGWLKKHRSERPAVAVVFVDRLDLVGGPSQWTAVLNELRTVKESCENRNAKFLVVPVGNEVDKDLPPDRLSALKSYLSIDQKCVQCIGVSLVGGGPSVLVDEDIRSLAQQILQFAWAYYESEANRVDVKYSNRTAFPPEINTWVAFKLGVLAEFRQDWRMAVEQYRTAYDSILAVPPSDTATLQRFHEVKSVAELVHLKLTTLLLHQHKVQEGLEQFRLHIRRFRNTPGIFSPGVLVSHLGWVAKQYEAIGDMIKTKVEDKSTRIPNMSDCHPAFLMYHAAQAAIDRRMELATVQENEVQQAVQSVMDAFGPGEYIGQYKCRTASGGFRELSAVEFDNYLLVLETKSVHTDHTLNLLKRAFQLYRGTGATRRIVHLGMLMAQEHLAANEQESARKLLLQVSNTYRSDGWRQLLGTCLGRLRECASELNQDSEHITYSLELSSMASILDRNQRETMARSAAEALLAGPKQPENSESETMRVFEYHVELTDSAREQRDGVKGGRQQTTKSHQQDAGWSQILKVACGFVPPKDNPRRVVFGLALRNETPVMLPVTRVTAEFVDADGHRRREEMQCEEMTGPPRMNSNCDELEGAASGQVMEEMQLCEGEWNRMWTAFKPRCAGDLALERVIVHIGLHAVVVFSPEGLDTPLDSIHSPFKEPAVQTGNYKIRIKHVGALPTVTVSGPRYALVGESVPVTIQVCSECEIASSQVTISAASSESACSPTLSLTGPSGKLEGSYSEGTVAVGALEADSTWTCTHKLFVNGPGQVTVLASMQLSAHFHLDQSVDIVFEEPFCMSVQLSTAPHTYVLLPEQSEFKHKENRSDGQSMWSTSKLDTRVPVNESIFMHVWLESVARCEIRITGVELEQDAESPAQLTSLSPPPREALVRKGDLETLLYTFSVPEPFNEVSPGNLKISWQRCGQLELRKTSTGEINSGTSSPMAPPHSSTEQNEASIQTTLPLQAISAVRPILTVAATTPAAATAGTSFPFTVRMRSDTMYPEELQIGVKDADGYLFCGERNSMVTLLPKQLTTVCWEMVAYSAGRLKLPKVKLTSARMDCWLEVDGIELCVKPARISN